MHQGALAARYQRATARIVEQLAQLGQRLGVPVDTATIRAVQGRERFERAMKAQEALAACLDELLQAPLPPALPDDRPKRTRSKKDGLSE